MWEFLVTNWLWILFVAVFIAMHRRPRMRHARAPSRI